MSLNSHKNITPNTIAPDHIKIKKYPMSTLKKHIVSTFETKYYLQNKSKSSTYSTSHPSIKHT